MTAPSLAAYAAVLTDLDGTLIDSSAPIRRAWTAFALRHALDPDVVVHEAEGCPAMETAARLAPDAPDEPRRLADAELHDTDGIVALPGARELLLTAPRSLAIVTSCFRALARVRLDAAGLPVPATLVGADDVARGKPDPEPYLLGAARLGVAPERCVVLEDAPAGIAAGRAAGMTVIAVRGTHSDAELGEADAIVDGVADLVETPDGPR